MKQWPTVQKDKKTRKWETTTTTTTKTTRGSVSLFEKKSLDLLKRKKVHIHRIVKRINWWEGRELILEMLQKFKNSCILPKLYLVRYGKPERRRKIVNKTFVQWSVARVLRNYKLNHYAARRTNTDRRKLLKGLNKAINPKKLKRGFEPILYKAVINFLNRDDVSTALPRKRDTKKVK